MAIQLQLRKGSKSDNDAFTGAEAELTYDTTTKGLRIHDGTTQGGHEIPVIIEFQAPTADNNYTWYKKYSNGWVEQGGKGLTNLTIVLPVEMADDNYFITTGNNTYSDSVGTPVVVWYDKTATGFALQGRWNGNATTGIGCCWRVEGFAA